MTTFLEIPDGRACPLADLPCLSPEAFTAGIQSALRTGRYVAALFPMGSDLPRKGTDTSEKGTDTVRLFVALGHERARSFLCALGPAVGSTYPSLTPDIPQLHAFERELAENEGLTPVGHPRLQPLRAASGDVAWTRRAGDESHEVAVGPVHAGVIEPGHFRFQCLGENVDRLEIELGYQRRGVEQLLAGGPDARTEHLVETAAGDTSAAAALCHARLLAALRGTPPPDAPVWDVLLELERVANHVGDLGALAGDVAYLPTVSYCGRIRGEYLNMTAEICGNRFGRGAARARLTPAAARKIRDWIARVKPELDNALDLLFDQPGVLDRFEGTGTVPRADSDALGLVGVAGRASREFGGDVMARATVRRLEIEDSHAVLTRLLDACAAAPGSPETVSVPPPAVSVPPLAPDRIAVASAAAWRGPLVHAAVTDAAGRFARYKIVDPSFHNWHGLERALRGEQISNFPVCNKSFNLSYCGHDL